MRPAETLVLNRDAGVIAPPLAANRVLRNTRWWSPSSWALAALSSH